MCNLLCFLVDYVIKDQYYSSVIIGESYSLLLNFIGAEKLTRCI